MASTSRPHIELRGYQSRIAKECERANTIVVLPTGSGKTLIAADAIKKLGGRALLLVPTCLLVEQQRAAVHDFTGLRVAGFKGGMIPPPRWSFDVLVATPEAFKVAQHGGAHGGEASGSSAKNQSEKSSGPSSSLEWSAFSVVVFDEVHHVLKDHPYRKLALALRLTHQRQQHRPRVIGLTASYTYAIGEKKTKASLEALCRELHVVQCESATPEELHADGYHAMGARAEVSLPPPSAFTSSTVAGIVPEALRRPHEMSKIFFRREKEGGSTPFAARLMACVRAMEETIAESGEVESFASPLPPAGSLAPREWGAYAHELARGGAVARKGGKGGSSSSGPKSRRERDRPMLAQLEHWYEAVKTLVVSWEEDVDIAATILDMGGCGRFHKTAVEVWPTNVRGLVSFFWGEVPTEFARFEHLKQVLMDKYKKHGRDGSSKTDGTGFRGIVFVQQRVTTHVLKHVISSDPDLKPLISPACLYSHGSRATASLSVSKAVGETNLGLFRAGLVNLLICTVVAEEGMDVPASNCVIRFDPMHHAVSLVQGRGRARQDGSSHVVLNERPDRPSHVLEREAQQQLRFVRDFKPDTRRDAAADAALLTAQRSRERGARSVLEKLQPPTFGALSAVNTFAKKTKVELEESLCKVASGLWRCTLTYESSLRKLHAFGEAPGKKIARKLAAAQLVADLLEVVPA